MYVTRRKEGTILFIGDIIALFISLYITLIVRFGAIPSSDLLVNHLLPFSFLFLVSVLLYFIAGLYEHHTRTFERRIPRILLNVQILNAIVAIAFFYFIPFLDITPKITLFIYLVISLAITTAWRMYIFTLFRPTTKRAALLIAKGKEANDLFDEVNKSTRYGITFVDWFQDAGDFGQDVFLAKMMDIVRTKNITFIAADFGNRSVHPLMKTFYTLMFSGVEFVDSRRFYEEIFNRIPLSHIDEEWCLENISTSSKLIFDTVKRLIDLTLAGSLYIASLIFYPIVWIAMRFDDKGTLFSYQVRVGKHNKPIRIMKFRTMTVANDEAAWGKMPAHSSQASQAAKKGMGDIAPIVANKVTRLGKFLRKSRIDELPQLWNVVRGDISLIGPRPEFPDPVEVYSSKIPYYNLRHIVKPGLSGWAQIYHEQHPHHGIDAEETRNKLSYDLYYIKNRSLWLDFKIALQTVKVLLSFAGR